MDYSGQPTTDKLTLVKDLLCVTYLKHIINEWP